MKIPSRKPRNRIAVIARFLNAGPHDKKSRVERNRVLKEIRREIAALKNGHPDFPVDGRG